MLSLPNYTFGFLKKTTASTMCIFDKLVFILLRFFESVLSTEECFPVYCEEHTVLTGSMVVPHDRTDGEDSLALSVVETYRTNCVARIQILGCQHI